MNKQKTITKKFNKDQHRKQIRLYAGRCKNYKTYADTLQKILEKWCALNLPTAIVQARPKSLSSFSEKAARKSKEIDDPLNQFTDLCGARVITHSQPQVDKVCRFIRENFIIDEAKSKDKITQLDISEFGYLSFHYIVTIEADRILGVKIPKEVKKLKAEIQVRTLLQHAWADISHDRVYKNPIRVPEKWIRESARLAALMESADQSFLAMTEGIDSFNVNYGVFMDAERFEYEKEILRAILDNEQDKNNKSKHALSLARLMKASGEWKEIIRTLKPYARERTKRGSAIRIELGNAYCMRYRSNPYGPEYNFGQAMLEREVKDLNIDQFDCDSSSLPSIEAGRIRFYSITLKYLADSYSRQEDKSKKARDSYYRAYLMDPDDPYLAASFLEFEIICQQDRDFVRLMRPTLLTRIRNCKQQIGALIGIPWVYRCMGKLWLLCGEPYSCLSAYARAIDYFVSGRVRVQDEFIDDEIVLLSRMNSVEERPDLYKWVDKLLILAKVAKKARSGKGVVVWGRLNKKAKIKAPVLIIAGSSAGISSAEVRKYRALLKDAFENFRGTIITGGTKSGIPGLIGSIIGPRCRGTQADCRLIGYIPQSILPSRAAVDRRYCNELVTSEGKGFSPYEPLQYWTDILASGINPKDVKVLGINGGDIAGFEYRLALALGATVAILESSGRAAEELTRDEIWANHDRLFPLPHDPLAAWAFLNLGIQSKLTKRQIERAARKVSENHRKNKIKQLSDPAFKEWKELREDFKESNRQQVLYMEEILRHAGYVVKQARSKKVTHPKFSPAEIELMAEMEHARWIIERFNAGWKYGPVKDSERKISPYLVAWNDLSDDIKEYDRHAVRNFPAILGLAGFKVSKRTRRKKKRK